MAEKTKGTITSKLDCCPELQSENICDTLNLRYLLPYWVVPPGGKKRIKVEVVLHFELKRCSGELVLGDPIYTTTLLPGEKVRLYTSDRHSKWSYDSESELTYRHETTSEESFYTAGMAKAMSDLTVNQSGVSVSSFEESWSEGGAGADISILGFINVSGGGSGGNYDAQSIKVFSSNLSKHAEASSAYVAASVRAKSATAIGEVERRNHAEGESEAHYEASTRTFHNPNQCRAITYLFHKIHKKQDVYFNLTAITRNIADPAAPTEAYQRPTEDYKGGLKVVPQAIPAHRKDRLEIEKMARASTLEQRMSANLSKSAVYRAEAPLMSMSAPMRTVAVPDDPVDFSIRKGVLERVDEKLKDTGLIEADGMASKALIKKLSWHRQELLPTPGILIRGCLDECDTCEPALQEQIKLDLEKRKLKNELLKRQIELLEKSQKYRCCPPNGDGTDND